MGVSRGYWDYGTPQYQTATTISDLGAVIAGLRGVLSMDGRGRVVVLDDFDAGLGSWKATTAGAGVAPVAVNIADKMFRGPVVAKLAPVAVGGVSGISRDLYLAKLSRTGIETNFLLGANSADIDLTVSAYNSDDSRTYSATLRYRQADQHWTLSTAGTPVVLDWSTFLFPGPGWMPVKLVVDPLTKTAVRAVIAGVEVDLTGAGTLSSFLAAPGYCSYLVRAVGLDTHVNPLYLGYAILTSDEP